MLQPLVDEQEQGQKTSQESPGPVSVLGIKKKPKKDRQCKNITYDDTVVQVGDNVELSLAHRENNVLAGNKNGNGSFDGYLKMSSTPIVRPGLQQIAILMSQIWTKC